MQLLRSSRAFTQGRREAGPRQSAAKLTAVTIIGTYAPRQCGIATFAQDLRNAMVASRPSLRAHVAMMSEECSGIHPLEVIYTITERERAAYARLRDRLNETETEAVSLQHEYGIFGGPDGAWILDTLRDLNAPIVTTCHTVLEKPSQGQRQVLCEIGRLSAKMVVMTAKGSRLLMDVYGVPESNIAVIPHGIPDTDPASLDREALRLRLGWSGRKILLTAGMLSPNKGLQDMISAMPRILATHPDVLYVVAGATHPNLIRSEGETYRKSLIDLAENLGVADKVRFMDRFIPRDQLVELIVASDLFVTPYQNEAQITSGMLAYASGLGKPVISTPYWHARELLDDGRGVLVPFASPRAMAETAVELFRTPEKLQWMSETARAAGRLTTWRETGRRYLQLLDGITTGRPAGRPVKVKGKMPFCPPIQHLHRLTGPLGILQHAKCVEPDPEQGYCTDDNARALIAAIDLRRCGHPDKRLGSLAAGSFEFLREAFDPQNGRFRNFRSVSGDWLDGPGSEDSHGRALWALGHAVRYATDDAMRGASMLLFQQALPAVTAFTSPRSWSFALLGLGALREGGLSDETIFRTQAQLAGRLKNLHHDTATETWCWFEDVVTYDNARLPQALLVTSEQTGDRALLAVAMTSLAWLMHWQTAPERHFRAIGSNGFFRRDDQSPALWDQQPLEAQASLAACLTAHRLTGSRDWLEHAERSFAWFLGANDSGLPVGDFSTGACFDGVHPGGLNHNCGAESTLAFLQACADMHLKEFASAAVGIAPGRTNALWSPV